MGKRGGVVGQVLIAFGDTAEDRHGDERQHAGNRISQRLLASELGEVSAQTLHQTGDFAGFGAAARGDLGQHLNPRRRQLRGAEFDTSLLDQFTHPHLLGVAVRLIEVHRAALPAAGEPQLAPATDFVGGAAILLRVHKALGQCHRMTPGAFPIRTQTRQHQLHEPTDQVGIMALGQNIQTRIVDHQGQPLTPLLLGPTNKLIPRLEVKGGGAPRGHRKPLAFPSDGVTKLLTHQLRAVQVMVLD